MGKIPIVYSITPFTIKRPFEWLDNYLNNEGCPVKLLCGGRGRDYSEDGYTHDATNDLAWLSTMRAIKVYEPNGLDEGKTMTHEWLFTPGPAYLNLKR